MKNTSTYKIFTICFFAIVSSGCFFKKEKTLKLGEFTSLTGTEASFGINANRGVRMAIEEVNSTGGINGRHIELVTKDTESSRSKTIDVVNDLIESDDVIALIGEVASERSMAAAPIAQIKGRPMISPASTNPGITEVGNFIFRSCYVDPFQGFAMAKFAYVNLNLRRVAIYRNDRSNYSSGLAEYFKETFENLGGTVIFESTYSTGDTDFSQGLREIKESKPDGIFIPGYYSEVQTIATQLKKKKVNIPLLGGDGWDSQELFQGKNSVLEGSYYTNHFTIEDHSHEAVQFIKNFKKIYGAEPDGVAAMGYDAAGIMIKALKSAKSFNPDDVRIALAKTKNYPGVTGRITFDQNRNPMKSIVVLKISKGKARFISRIEP